MKSLSLLAALMLSLSAFADDTSKACGPGIYCVEQMLCLGRVAGTPPPNMNPNNAVVMLTLRSFKAQQNGKPLTDSLMMQDTAVGKNPSITLEQAKSLADWTTGQFGPPLRVNGKTVKSNWTTLGFSDGLSLTITASEAKSDHRFDHLTGTEKIEGSPVGDYTLNYECLAIVVNAPSLVLDPTKGN